MDPFGWDVAADATLNANIVQSAQLLVGSIQASAAQQQDLNGYYATLVAKKGAELGQLNETVTQLGSSLDDQKINVRIAVAEYKQAVKDWETRKAVAFVLSMATTMFDIATSFAMPVGEIKAVAALGEAAQAFQKLLNIINNVFKAYTAADTQINGLLNAQSALDDVAGVGFDITSNQQWDEMNANMSFILNLGPGDDPEMLKAKLELLKEFNLLLIRGKAWISAKSAASQLAADLYNQQKQQLLSQRQQARLDALSASLKPEKVPSLDPSTLDLAGLTSSLVYTRSQLLSMLASTFVLQDQALQYQNLQDATPITSFDLLSFKSSVLRQATNRIAAQNRLNAIQKSVTNPIGLHLQTASAQLTQGRVYVFAVLLDHALFSEYVDARIVSVNLALSGVTTLKIAPIGPLSAASPYTVMTYTGTLVGGLANLQVVSDNPRYAFSVVNPATTPGVIQVSVSGIPLTLAWNGGQPANPNVWNLTVSNWLNGLVGDTFFSGDSVKFDDAALTNVVAISGTLSISPLMSRAPAMPLPTWIDDDPCR